VISWLMVKGAFEHLFFCVKANLEYNKMT